MRRLAIPSSSRIMKAQRQTRRIFSIMVISTFNRRNRWSCGKALPLSPRLSKGLMANASSRAARSMTRAR